jgi:hypothetical protein
MGTLSLGGTTTFDKMAEMHDEAVKLFAKHGVPWAKIRKGIVRARHRNPVYNTLSLSYNYDSKNPEETKRVNAIRQEWGPIINRITGGKRVDSYTMSELGTGQVVVYRLTPAAAKSQLPMLGEYYKLLVKLKRMLDPNHIMNPGKFMDIEPY